MSVRNPFAAALAANFREAGIYRGLGTPRQVAGEFTGPVCFYCNNVPDDQYEGEQEAEKVLSNLAPEANDDRGYLAAPALFLNENPDEVVLAVLDALNA